MPRLTLTGGLVTGEAKYEPAIADLKQVLELDGDKIVAHYNLGKVHAALGNREQRQEYSQALRLQPDFVPAYLARAVVCESAGRHDLALSDCNAALKIDPRSASTHYLRGTIHRHLGQHGEADADLSEAIQLDPAFALATSNGLGSLPTRATTRPATGSPIFQKRSGSIPKTPSPMPVEAWSVT